MKVLLDPGHPSYPGNKGAVNKDFVERVWTLDTARSIWSELHKRGHRCDLTRHDYTTPVRLSRRQAQSDGYDLYVSIHCDKNKDPRVSGLVTYVKPGDRMGYRTALQISKAYGHPGTYVWNGAVKQRRGRPLIASRKRFKRVHNCIRYAKCPAVLVECGYVSNAEDLHRLKNERGAIVDAIVSGIIGSRASAAART